MSAIDPSSEEYRRQAQVKHFVQKAVRGSITATKLKFFESWRGDDDRLDPAICDKVLSYDEWGVNDKLVDDAFLVEKGLASAEFAKKHLEELAFACDTEASAIEVARVAVKIRRPTLVERFVRWTTGKK